MAINYHSNPCTHISPRSVAPQIANANIGHKIRLISKYARIKLLYFWRHRRLPNMLQPTLFTELVQIRKVNEPSSFISGLIDKVSVKKFAGDRIGSDWIIPTLWHGTVLPDAPIWPYPFIVKSSHGCNQYIVVKSAADDWKVVRRKTARWMRRTYGAWLDEGYYAGVRPGLIVEPYIGDVDALPIDYKIYVFGAKAEFTQVHLDRATNHRWAIFDRDWSCLTTQNCDRAQPPASLNAMIEAAETLAKGIDFVRVDFYEIAEKPLFGEMTFYPGSGLDPFDPYAIDTVMGALWLDVIATKKESI